MSETFQKTFFKPLFFWMVLQIPNFVFTLWWLVGMCIYMTGDKPSKDGWTISQLIPWIFVGLGLVTMFTANIMFAICPAFTISKHFWELKKSVNNRLEIKGLIGSQETWNVLSRISYLMDSNPCFYSLFGFEIDRQTVKNAMWTLMATKIVSFLWESVDFL